LDKFPHYTKLQQQKMLNPLKSYYLHGAYLFRSQNSAALALVSR
jgi:hypothetical protein